MPVKGHLLTIADKVNNPSLLPCFAAGLVAIVLLRMVIPGHWGASVAAVSALAIIFWLGLHYYKNFPGQKLLQAGDDLYYLGLLFTLISLMYSLVVIFLIFGEEGSQENRIDNLIGSFGIALVSTVGGILGRIILQGKADIDGPAEEPLDDILDKLRAASNAAADELMRVRMQMREATDAFAHYVRVTQEQAEDISAHSGLLITEFNEKMKSSARVSLDETAAVWRTAMTAVREESERSLQQAQSRWTEMADHVGETTRTMQTQLDTSANAMTVSVAVARQQLDAGATAASELLQHLSASNRSFETLSGLLETTEGHVRALGEAATYADTGLQARAAEVVKAHETLALRTREQQEALAGALTESTASVTRSLSAAETQLKEALRAFEESLQAYVQSAHGQKESVGRSLEELNNMVGSMQAVAGDWTQSMERLHRLLPKWMRRFKDE